MCNISSGTVSALIPSGGVGHGNIRGIVVFLTGFDVDYNTGKGIPPIIFADTTGTCNTSLYQILNTDGWIFLAVPSNEWSANGYGSQAVYNAVNADAGFGTNYVKGMLHWWDHIVNYCATTYPNMPIVPFGQSWGGFEVLTLANNRANDMVAAGCHVPATWVSNVNHLFTAPINFGNTNCSGINLPTNALSTVTIPMAVGWGTNDEALGWTGTSTVASGFTTTAAASVTTLPLVSATGYLSTGSQITVLTTGGSGYATYEIGTISGNNLNGLTFISGSGNVVVGSTVVQNPLQQILSGTSSNVVGNSTADVHEFGPNDSGMQLTSTPTPTALSSMGTLTVEFTNNMTGSSGNMAIFASDNLWHVVTFTGSTGTTFTGCTYSGTQSATVTNGSPICLNGNGSTNQFSYPYWFSTVVDPLCPRQY